MAFHNGDSFPESEVAPKVERLRDAQLRSLYGAAPVLELRQAGKRTIGTATVLRGGSQVLSVRTVPNLIELTPRKFLDYIKEEGLDQVIEWRTQHDENRKPGRERYTEYAKSLILAGQPDDGYRMTVGFAIEIVPDVNPESLHAGGRLPVHILFHGKGAAGLQVEEAWTANGKTKTDIVGPDRPGRSGRGSTCQRGPLAASQPDYGTVLGPGSCRLGKLLGQPYI